MCKKIEAGIHTYSLYHKIFYTEAQNLIELLKETGHCYPTKENEENYNGTYVSDLFADSGVKIYIYRYYDYSGFSPCITPCSLLKGSYAAQNLYHPTPKKDWEVMDGLTDILNKLEVKSDSDDIIRAHEMSVCRADPCINFYLDSDDEVSEYLRILKKSFLIPHYYIVKFEKLSSRVKNVEEANTHSYRIKSRKAEFTAYDKIYEMQLGNRCPEELNDTHILRIEAGLKRDALLKRLNKRRKCPDEKLLENTAENTVKILVNFLKKMRIGTGNHIQYRDAEAFIVKAELEDKMKKRMLFLICKASDSNLSSALGKICEKYNLNDNQCERILNQFDALGISPITLRNDSRFQLLPSLLHLLQKDQDAILKRDDGGFIILQWKNDIPKKLRS